MSSPVESEERVFNLPKDSKLKKMKEFAERHGLRAHYRAHKGETKEDFYNDIKRLFATKYTLVEPEKPEKYNEDVEELMVGIENMKVQYNVPFDTTEMVRDLKKLGDCYEYRKEALEDVMDTKEYLYSRDNPHNRPSSDEDDDEYAERMEENMIEGNRVLGKLEVRYYKTLSHIQKIEDMKRTLGYNSVPGHCGKVKWDEIPDTDTRKEIEFQYPNTFGGIIGNQLSVGDWVECNATKKGNKGCYARVTGVTTKQATIVFLNGHHKGKQAICKIGNLKRISSQYCPDEAVLSAFHIGQQVYDYRYNRIEGELLGIYTTKYNKWAVFFQDTEEGPVVYWKVALHFILPIFFNVPSN